VYIQVLTLKLNEQDREEANRFYENAVLGLAEHDGFISDTCLTRPGHSIAGGMIAWADWASLEQFRRSELYAKLLLSPLVEDVYDRAFAVSDAATPASIQTELLAVA
jgi:hypothetical protein